MKWSPHGSLMWELLLEPTCTQTGSEGSTPKIEVGPRLKPSSASAPKFERCQGWCPCPLHSILFGSSNRKTDIKETTAALYERTRWPSWKLQKLSECLQSPVSGQLPSPCWELFLPLVASSSGNSVGAFPEPLCSGTMPFRQPCQWSSSMSSWERGTSQPDRAGSPWQVTPQQNGLWKDQSQSRDPSLLLHKSKWKGCSKTQHISYWSPGNLTRDNYGLLNLIITEGYILFALSASSKMKWIYLFKFNIFWEECYNFQGMNAIRWSLTMFLLACIFLKCFACIFF